MTEKCPVCQTDCEEGATVCSVCSFADELGINRTWITKEDASNWLETVVKPYRMQWEASIDKIRERMAMFQNCISTSCNHTVGLKTDGTVVAVGDNKYGQCEVKNWCNIVAVSAGYSHTIGLKVDGTVVAVGNNEYGQCNVEEWEDIILVFAGNAHPVGLKADGTVVAIGLSIYDMCNTKEWYDIVDISAGFQYTVGLKDDGTIVAVGSREEGMSEARNWQNIVAISADSWHTIGLKDDGTVVAVGNNVWEQCNVENWQDIVEISTCQMYTVGLKVDGTIIVAGKFFISSCLEEWSEIVAVSIGCAGKDEFQFGCDAENYHLVGLKVDGTVVATGDNTYGQCNIEHWSNIGPFYKGNSIKSKQSKGKKDATDYYNRAMVALRNNDYDRTISYLSQVIKLTYNNSEVYALRGLAYFRKGYYNKAIEDTETALRINPEHANADSFKSFIKKVRQVQEHSGGDSAIAHFEGGMAAFQKGDFDRAIVSFSEVICLDPNAAIAYNMRGNAYQFKKDYKRALLDFDEAIRLSPNETSVAAVYYNRAQTYFMNKEPNKAIGDLETVLRINPENAKAMQLLQMIQMVSRF